jgi:class I fructose-bisphosphate aldolase
MIEKLEKISHNGKYVFLAYDQGFEHGPTDFNEKNVDPEYIMQIAAEGGASAVILQKGNALKYWKGTKYEKTVPLIIKINGKANVWQGEAYAPQNTSVEFAHKLGAVAVGYTIFLGSEFDYKCFAEFGKIVEDAHKLKMPVIAWVYPRGKFVAKDDTPEITAHAARTALELGADMAKIKYCGSTETFAWAVKAAGRTKVVMSGGNKTDDPRDFIKTVKSVMDAGGAGVAVGRNVWQADEPLKVMADLKKVVFG